MKKERKLLSKGRYAFHIVLTSICWEFILLYFSSFILSFVLIRFFDPILENMTNANDLITLSKTVDIVTAILSVIISIGVHALTIILTFNSLKKHTVAKENYGFIKNFYLAIWLIASLGIFNISIKDSAITVILVVFNAITNFVISYFLNKKMCNKYFNKDEESLIETI